MAARRTYRTKAIVLDTTKLAEQDLILTMLAASGAQVRAVAKGARKPGGRLAARAELFCESDFLIAEGKSLGIVSEASTVDPHEGLRGDLERVSAASAVCEVARLTCFEETKDPFLFDICKAALGACEEASDLAHLDLIVAAYTFKVLAHSGWWPALDGCVSCGDPDVAWFSAQTGGLLCESCARDVAGAERVSAAEVAWLRSLLRSTFIQLLGADIDQATASLLLSLSHVWAATQLDARLKAYEFLMSV
ncbi:MAG: DNA repair protein RecO [Olegusella sp.]|nr:DNA repair protein RecO [Olegusella sp.]